LKVDEFQEVVGVLALQRTGFFLIIHRLPRDLRAGVYVN
jgi:hypothetical protein